MYRISFFLVLILLGCSIGRQKQVWLSELQYTHYADSDNIVRVYIDKQGSIYPSDSIYIPYKEFFIDNKTKSYSGSLKSYFTGNGRKKKQFNSNAIEELAKHYKIDTSFCNDTIFKKAQEVIINRKIQEIRGLTKRDNNELYIFIHGFNDPNPTGDYQKIRSLIEDRTENKNNIYLELYWDGLTANNASPTSSVIWANAQFNAYYTAIALRRLLNGLQRDLDVKIITHSAGAIVATATLFNTTRRIKKVHKKDYYDEWINIPCPRNKEIRLAMLAPAIPGSSTFLDFNKRYKDSCILSINNNVSKVIIGFNERDYALTKKKFGFYFSKKFGSTSLGSNRKHEIHKAKCVLDTMGYNNIMYEVNFTDYCEKENEHGLVYYLQNKEKTENFLKNLID